MVSVLVLPLAVASELLIRLRVEPADNILKHARLFAESQNSSAAFGDSHAALGFIGTDDITNLAFPGLPVEAIDRMARTYFQTRQPHLVILQVDPSLFSFERNKFAVATADEHMSFLQGNKNQGGHFLPRLLLDYHKSRIMNYWRVYHSNGQFDTAFKFHTTGWQERDEVWSNASRDTAEISNAVQIRRPRMDMAHSKEFRVLESLIEFFIGRNARVCLVSFPYSPEFTRQIGNDAAYGLALSQFDFLASKYGVPYLNGFYRFSKEGDTAMFYDPDHLNSRGAKVFSSEVIAKCAA